jgi:hypothetical protein
MPVNSRRTTAKVLRRAEFRLIDQVTVQAKPSTAGKEGQKQVDEIQETAEDAKE